MFKWLKDWRAYNKEFKRREGMPWFEILRDSVEKELKKANDKKLGMLLGLVEDLTITIETECMKRTKAFCKKTLGYEPDVSD